MRTNLNKVKDEIVAIFASDIHLSHTAPIWRSAEPDWYEAMKRPLDELKYLKERFCCGVIYAGDIFDDWKKTPPELINFAIRNLPKGYAVAGQHDMPNHNIMELSKSGFYTLLESETIQHVHQATHIKKGFDFDFYDYGEKIEGPVGDGTKKEICICIAHEYRWIKGHSYQEADIKQSLDMKKSQFSTKYKDYDIVVLGDNHSGFLTKVGKTTFFNCGSLMRRTSDQKDYHPMVGLLTGRGKIIPYYLDISEDKYIETEAAEKKEKQEIDMTDFMKELEILGDAGLDFVQAVKLFCKKHKIAKSVRELIKEIVSDF